MKFAIFIFVVCFSAQAFARPTPDDIFHEFLESMRVRFNNALNQVQELANRALESIKGSLLNSFQSAQNATKEGLDIGKSWAKFGESSARKFIENTAGVSGLENATEQITPMQIFYNQVQPVDISPGEMPQGQYSGGQF